MTAPQDDLLITTEGVDEGSAASTAEGPDGTSDPEAAGLVSGTHPDRVGGTHGGSEPAAPYVVESAESRAARASDTGQQLSAGEG